MRDRDAATKQYMSHKDVVADAFNFYLYGGEQRILPERLRKRDATEVLVCCYAVNIRTTDSLLVKHNFSAFDIILVNLKVFGS